MNSTFKSGTIIVCLIIVFMSRIGNTDEFERISSSCFEVL